MVITDRQCSYSELLQETTCTFPLLDQTLVLCPLCEEAAEYLQGGGSVVQGHLLTEIW